MGRVGTIYYTFASSVPARMVSVAFIPQNQMTRRGAKMGPIEKWPARIAVLSN